MDNNCKASLSAATQKINVTRRRVIPVRATRWARTYISDILSPPLLIGELLTSRQTRTHAKSSRSPPTTSSRHRPAGVPSFFLLVFLLSLKGAVRGFVSENRDRAILETLRTPARNTVICPLFSRSKKGVGKTKKFLSCRPADEIRQRRALTNSTRRDSNHRYPIC